MMFRKCLLMLGLSALLAAGWSGTAAAAARLDADTMAAALQTADPSEKAYVSFVVTLVNQGRLPRNLVDAVFQWARRKPVRHKKFQYFKRALIIEAAKIRIPLPESAPDSTRTVNGFVLFRILGIDIFPANVTVTIRGTGRVTTTDASGQFTFPTVPFGRFILDARGIVALLPRKGSTMVTFPSLVEARKSGFVEIRVR